MAEPVRVAPHARAGAEARRAAGIEEARKPEEQRNLTGQVVNIAKPEVEIRPDDSAKFLAEYDNKVNKETKGKPGLRAGGRAGQRRVASVTQPQPGSRPSPPRAAGGPRGAARAVARQ